MHLKVVLVLLLGKQALGARILALMVVASHSHHIWNVKYLKALADRGHHITYLSIDEYKNPPENIRNVLIEGVYEAFGDADFTEISNSGPYRNMYYIYQWDQLESDLQLRSKGLRVLKDILRTEKFDLVVHDVNYSLFLLGAVDVLGRPPAVGITAFGVPPWVLEILGNPLPCSSAPHFFSTYSDKMNILQRADNYFLHLFSVVVHWLNMRKQNEYSIECFGKNVRPLEQILDDINIIMVNSNHGLDYVFPKVPGLIPVGGLHIEEPKPLPQDLQSYLDESTDGVVFFSLGSNIQSSKIKKEKVEVLLTAFKELSPVRVLWKWEADVLPGKPDNVKVGKWFPQNDILAHPNVRLFFTHSGMLSTQEAIYHGKPIVALPIFVDQRLNAKKCVERGIGEQLSFASLTVDNIVQTIQKVLLDPRYAENARNASAVFRDQIVTPLEQAVYWTEYAIRHKGAPHLRHSSRSLSWYQNWMLDVLLISSCLVVLVLFFVYKSCKLVITIVWNSQGSKAKTH